MELRIRPARPPEFEDAGRVTALAYREFVRPGERAWNQYLEHIADVAGRAQHALVLVAVDGDDRILGSSTLELEDRIDEDDTRSVRERHTSVCSALHRNRVAEGLRAPSWRRARTRPGPAGRRS